MKGLIALATFAAVGASLQITCTGAFLAPSPFRTHHSRAHYGTLSMSYALAPEPEGGEEMTALVRMGGSRMKNMGENPDIKSDEGVVNKYWLNAIATGELVAEIRTTILKESAKNANFPGFRKGQIPPYAQPQITGFAVQEALIRTVQSGVEAYGLKALPGSDGEVTINEEVKEISQSYVLGAPVDFTATFSAIADPSKATIDAESVEEAGPPEKEAEASSD